eukprot:TRINITY_DN38606_c0_g1_i1.p1 TRINITY_DN38606_c0_g1~~TRINITY_DN38606_c0_g1_i1.p1  ORF type:complete len:299 (-),score=54.70 TRINITY_DN38606_c0_g1_i1:186-983(-)
MPGAGAGGMGGFPEGFRMRTGFQPRNPEDLFKEFFGGEDPFSMLFGSAGGDSMGGMGAFPGMGGSFRSAFPGGSMRMNMGGGQRKDPPIIRDLQCTLEELYNGTKRKLKVRRTLMDSSGQAMQVEELIEIDVKPGWKEGTKITYPEKGDEHPGVIPADLQFVIKEKSHNRFKRDSNDLIYVANVPLVEALCGGTVTIQHLDGRQIEVPFAQLTNSSMERRKRGEGMPISRSGGKDKGDLIVKFNVAFPRKEFSEEQKQQLRQILQ